MAHPSVNERPLIERLARHLAQAPDQWTTRMEDAASILAILKDPDASMREAGDETAWRAMIDAALRDRWTVAPAAAQAVAPPPSGADEEGEVQLSPDQIGSDHADWVHLHSSKEKSS